MDILARYKKEYPERPHPAVDSESVGDSILLQIIMKVSAGKIKKKRHAQFILLSLAILFFSITATIIVTQFNLTPVKRFSKEEARKQLEAYRKIQPF